MIKLGVGKCISKGEKVSLDFPLTIQKQDCRGHIRNGSPATEDKTGAGQTKSYADALRKNLQV